MQKKYDAKDPISFRLSEEAAAALNAITALYPDKDRTAILNQALIVWKMWLDKSSK